jgi:hypothetical protein
MDETNRSTRTFFAGSLVGGLIVLALWIGMLWGGHSSATEQGLRAHVASGSSASSHPVGHGPLRLERCRRTDARLVPALRAAGPALDQWEVHIDAMNKLVVGAITLHQANAFWSQSRVKAQRHIAVFLSAAHRASLPSRCKIPSHEAEHAPARLRSCARRVAADERALSAARTAISTWGHHVRDMDMLRMGKLSPTMANQMWLASWKEGAGQVRAYRAAAHAAPSAGSC